MKRRIFPWVSSRTTGSAALKHGDLVAQGDRFQFQRDAGLGFAASRDLRESFNGPHPHERRLSPDVQNRQ